MTVVFIVLALSTGLFVGRRLGRTICPHCTISHARDRALAELSAVERQTTALLNAAGLGSNQRARKHAAPKH
jgi:hypothetical protein